MSDLEMFKNMLANSLVETDYSVIEDGDYVYDGENYKVTLVAIATRIPDLMQVMIFHADGSFITTDIISLREERSTGNARFLPRYAVRRRDS